MSTPKIAQALKEKAGIKKKVALKVLRYIKQFAKLKIQNRERFIIPNFAKVTYTITSTRTDKLVVNLKSKWKAGAGHGQPVEAGPQNYPNSFGAGDTPLEDE